MLLPAMRGAHTHHELFRQSISIPGNSHMTFYQTAWWDEQFQLHVMFHVDATDMQVRKATNILIEVQGCFRSANAFYVCFLAKANSFWAGFMLS